MTVPDLQVLVDLIASARQAREPDVTIIQKVCDLGLSQEAAEQAVAEITQGLKAGVLFCVTGQQHDPALMSPAFLLAYKEGQRRYKAALPWWSPGRVLVLVLLVAVVVAVVLWLKG